MSEKVSIFISRIVPKIVAIIEILLNAYYSTFPIHRPLLAIDRESGKVKVNLEGRILLLLRESDCLAKLNLELPVVALTILSKRDHFTLINDSLQLLIEEFVATSRRVKLEVRPLLLPHLFRVSSLLGPGLVSLTWTKSEWKIFYENTREQIKTFDVLITRVHDVYTNRYSREEIIFSNILQ